jgi:hypothetical protein
MNRPVKIERTAANGDSWESVCTVDLDHDETWPATLPRDILGVLQQAQTDDMLVSNNQQHSTDGRFYRLDLKTN